MEKMRYTQYEETISVEGAEINVIVQIPDYEIYPAQVILRSGGKVLLNVSLAEFSAINEAVAKAMKEEGWEEGEEEKE